MTRDLFSFAQSILRNQPFSVRLGTALVTFTRGHAELALPIIDELRQQHGFVHGGVISYLADNALTFAGGSVLGDSVTVEYKVNYARPAKGEGRLLAIADVVSYGRSQAVVRCDVFLEPLVLEPLAGERVLCAAAQGTVRRAEAFGARPDAPTP